MSEVPLYAAPTHARGEPGAQLLVPESKEAPAPPIAPTPGMRSPLSPLLHTRSPRGAQLHVMGLEVLARNAAPPIAAPPIPEVLV